MKKLLPLAAVALAMASLALSGFLFYQSRTFPKTSELVTADGESVSAADVAKMESQLNALSSELYELRRMVGAVSAPDAEENSEGEAVVTSIQERIGNLENSVASLRSNYEGLSIDGASEERMAVFASEEGAIKADEYFEAGKYSIAAEGYLTYYRNFPDGPDSRGVLERARQSYRRAGYDDMAIWVQEEKMRIFPESRPKDLATLAEMQKDAGLYDDAISNIAEAAELNPEASGRLWSRMYWAWYNQLRDGSEAGLEAYRQVQTEIEDAGFADHVLNVRVEEKINEILEVMQAQKKKATRKTVHDKTASAG